MELHFPIELAPLGCNQWEARNRYVNHANDGSEFKVLHPSLAVNVFIVKARPYYSEFLTL